MRCELHDSLFVFMHICDVVYMHVCEYTQREHVMLLLFRTFAICGWVGFVVEHFLLLLHPLAATHASENLCLIISHAHEYKLRCE